MMYLLLKYGTAMVAKVKSKPDFLSISTFKK
jgi:hypothetical protein